MLLFFVGVGLLGLARGLTTLGLLGLMREAAPLSVVEVGMTMEGCADNNGEMGRMRGKLEEDETDDGVGIENADVVRLVDIDSELELIVLLNDDSDGKLFDKVVVLLRLFFGRVASIAVENPSS